jgi:hypothetical protein
MATVTGATSPNVNWTPVCQFTTTTTDSTGKTTTSNKTTCPPDPNFPNDPLHTLFGTFSDQQTTGTEVFVAASTLPDQTKFPGLLIIVTAQSVQNPKITGTISLTLNSGINVTFTPPSASVPVQETQTFNAFPQNDVQGKGVTWSITQQIPTATTGSTPNPYTPLATCSPTCGTITVPNANDPNTVVYTAPSTIPTAITPAQKNNTNSPTNLTIVAVANADQTRFRAGIITIIPGGPITFNGISPTIAPAGATLWDIYLDAPNFSSASKIKLSTQPVPKDSTSGQIKVLFPVPTASTSTTTTTSPTCSSTTPCSTGARLRLNAEDLAVPGTVTVSILDPAQPCNGIPAGTACTATGVGTFNILPVRPTTIGTVPDDIVQGGQTLSFPVTIDGGYFGPFGPNVTSPSNLIRVFFQSPGNLLTVDPINSSSRRLLTSLPANHINPSNPGLYPLYVAQATSAPSANPNNPSVTNMALFPDYSATTPAITSGASGIPAGTNPSAVDIDPTLGVLVVAETGSNTIEFFSIGNGSLSSLGQVTSTAAAPINVPTGVSVDRIHHTVAVVNYGSQTTTTNTDGSCKSSTSTGQSVTVLPIPGAGASAPTPFHVDLPFNMSVGSGAFQAAVCPAPMPYSIGVDPDSQLALVAYSSASTSSVVNLGFIVNLNPNSGTNNYGCALTDAITGQSPQSGPVGQCLFAQVTLNTGTYPQVAMAQRGHLALVTPGGSGIVRGVDVTKPSSANVIKSATLAAGLVTVTIDTTQCPPPLPNPTTTLNPCPFTLVPGNAGSVLIAGVVPTNAANTALFNGVFTVNVTSSSSFTYVVNNVTTSDSGAGTTANPALVFYGQPDQIFPGPATSQGVAVNPITSTAAIADANALGTNGPQIDLINGLDQSVSSISFFATCTAFTTNCSSSPELLATTNVAWQPYTNEVVSYNPKLGLVSVSDPVSSKRYAIVSGLGPSALAFPVSNGTLNTNLTLWGGVTVDPVTNQAFVVESGQAANPNATPPTPATPGQIEIINLAGGTPIKATHISEVIVPSPASSQGTIGGVPNALVPQAALACTPTTTTTCDLPGVKIFGSGFVSGMQVRLDGQDITTFPGGAVGTPANGGREVDVTIPHALLAKPHHYALDVLSGGAQSNAVDFIVIQVLDLSNVCPGGANPHPSSVAIADQIANGNFSPIALVSVTGCNDIVMIDIAPSFPQFDMNGNLIGFMDNPNFGQQIGMPIGVGTNPQGIAMWQQKGLAVVANNGSGTATVLDLKVSPPKSPLTADVTTGTNPTGVAIDEATGAAIVANTSSNTVSMINLGLLFPQPTTPPTTPPTTLTANSIGGIQQPIAVAIDPDRGINEQGIAVVTSVALSNGSAPAGALAVVEIGVATPALSNTISSGFVSSTPTGIVFDPTVVNSLTTNQGAFFANSSGTNTITEFVPEGGGSSVRVGINPTSLAINSQTGAILTSNSASNTISIVNTLSSPFKTQQTLGIPGSPTFGVAIDQFTNLAVIVDQANNRVLFFPMPH